MAEPLSNYEKACRDWQTKLKNANLREILSRVPGLVDRGDSLEILQFGRICRICKEDFHLSALDGGKLSMDARLNIYTLLWYCKKDAKNTGEWAPFRELPLASVFEGAFLQNVLRPLALTFAGMPEKLLEAGVSLGGLPVSKADAGFQINAFPEIPMRFLFWDGDEEFPPAANILYDRAAGDFIHPESLVTLATEGLRQLIHKADVPCKGSTFSVIKR